MAFFIVFLAILLSFVAVVLYFFSVAFVKHNIGDVDNVDDDINKPLREYKEEIRQGIEYNKSRTHKLVEVLSYDGLRLKARYYDSNSKKTVILFHGYRSSALRDFACAVEMYTKMGFNVLLCDQRSHGKSEGKLITFGVKESRDVLSWIDFVEKQYKPEKIVLGGMSMGATTVLLSLKYDLPDNVKAVVADCGFTSPVDIIKKVARKSFKINAAFFIPFLNLVCKLLGRFSITEDSTVDTIKNSDIPVMLIHGESDGFVPCEMSKKAFEGANEKSQLLLIKGADHGLSFMMDSNKVTTEIKKFLEKTV